MSNITISDTIFAVWDSKPNSAAAQARFSELLASTTKVFSDIEKAQLKTQLARTLGVKTHYEDAHKVLDEAEGVLRTKQTQGRELA